MAKYHIPTQALADYYRQMSKWILLFVIPLFIWMIYYNLEIQHGDLLTSVPIIIISLGAISFGMYRAVKQQKEVALSYRLLIDQFSIIRTQLNTPTIQLQAKDISHIEENAKGDISIIAHDKYQHIYIGPKINNREQLLIELKQFGPITIRTQKTLLEYIAPFTSLLMLALMAVFYTATNKVIVGVAGFSVLAILLWSAWQVWHNKNIQQHSRRNLWFQLLVFIGILSGLIAKLLA